MIATKDQNKPTGDSKIEIFDIVIDDLKARRLKGIATYGESLKPFNGRNALIDAYQEVLDLAVYIAQQIYEDTYVRPPTVKYEINNKGQYTIILNGIKLDYKLSSFPVAIEVSGFILKTYNELIGALHNEKTV